MSTTKSIIGLMKDPRGMHIRFYHDVFNSNAWRCLSATDQQAYMALVQQLRSTNNGDLSLTLKGGKAWHGIKSSATLAKSLRALVAVGLVAVTSHGRCCVKDGKRMPTLYRLTDYPTLEQPQKFIESSKATNEWKAVQTLGQGRELIRQAEKLAAEKEVLRKKTALQKLKLDASNIEVNYPIDALKIEVYSSKPASKIKAGGEGKMGRNPNAGAGSGKTGGFSNSESPASRIEALSIVAIHRGQLTGLDVDGTRVLLAAADGAAGHVLADAPGERKSPVFGGIYSDAEPSVDGASEVCELVATAETFEDEEEF